jgi:hypothetical protein
VPASVNDCFTSVDVSTASHTEMHLGWAVKHKIPHTLPSQATAAHTHSTADRVTPEVCRYFQEKQYLLPLSWIKPQFIGLPAQVQSLHRLHYTGSDQHSYLVRNCAQQLCLPSAAMYIHITADHYIHFNRTDATSLTTFCAPVLLAWCECCHNAAHHTQVLLNLAKSVWPITQTSQQYSRWVCDITPC